VTHHPLSRKREIKGYQEGEEHKAPDTLLEHPKLWGRTKGGGGKGKRFSLSEAFSSQRGEGRELRENGVRVLAKDEQPHPQWN